MKGWEYRDYKEKLKTGEATRWIRCPYRILGVKRCFVHPDEQHFADHPEICEWTCKKQRPKPRTLYANLDGLKLARRDPDFAKVHYQGRRIASFKRPGRVA